MHTRQALHEAEHDLRNQLSVSVYHNRAVRACWASEGPSHNAQALGEVQGHELIVKQCTGGKNTCVCGIDILSERLVCVFMYANAVFGPVVHAAVTNGEDTEL